MSKRTTDSPQDEAKTPEASILPGVNRLNKEALDASQRLLEVMGRRAKPSTSAQSPASDESPTSLPIESDPFLSYLPASSRDRLVAAELDVRSIRVSIRQGSQQGIAELENRALEMGVDPYGLSFAPGNNALAAAAMLEVPDREVDRAEARFWFRKVAWESWKLKPDVEAFITTKLPEIWRWAHDRFQLDDTMPASEGTAWKNWPLQARADSGSRKEETREDRARRRQNVLNPMLQAKGLTVNRWEVESGVKHKTGRHYYDGSTKTLRPDTRQKLAEPLGVKPGKLPD